MSEHQHEQGKPVYVPPTITRKDETGQDISMTCELVEFGKLVDDKLKGKKYPSIRVTKENLEHYLKFAGATYIAEVLDTDARRTFSGIYSDNIDEKTGKFDSEGWRVDAEDYTEGADTTSRLKQDKSDAQDQISALIDSDDYSLPEEDPLFIECDKKIKALNALINPIKKRIAKLELKNAAKTAKREETKKRKEAELAAKVAGTVAAKA